MSATVGGRTRRFADITLQQGAICLSVRYGGTEEEERARVREEARRRAVEGAWERERRRVEAPVLRRSADRPAAPACPLSS